MGNEFTNKILKLALPITAQQFMLALVSACDTFMLGIKICIHNFHSLSVCNILYS